MTNKHTIIQTHNYAAICQSCKQGNLWIMCCYPYTPRQDETFVLSEMIRQTSGKSTNITSGFEPSFLSVHIQNVPRISLYLFRVYIFLTYMLLILLVYFSLSFLGILLDFPCIFSFKGFPWFFKVCFSINTINHPLKTQQSSPLVCLLNFREFIPQTIQ